MLLQLLQVGHGFGKLFAGTLHEHDENVWSVGIQQGVNVEAFRGVDTIEQPAALIVVHELVLRKIIKLMAHRIKETEYRIDGGVVQKLILRIVHLSYVCGRFTDSATYTNHHEWYDHHVGYEFPPTAVSVWRCACYADVERGQQDCQHYRQDKSYYQIACTDTGRGFGGCLQVGEP